MVNMMIVKKIDKRKSNKRLFLSWEDYTFILESDNLEEVKTLIKDKINNTLISKSDKTKKYDSALIKERAELFRSKLVKKQSPSEVKVKAIFKMMGLHYDFKRVLYTDNSFYIVDFYLPDYNIVIEIDDDIKSNQGIAVKDRMRDAIVAAQIKRVYRIKGDELKDVNKVVEKINTYLKKFKK